MFPLGPRIRVLLFHPRLDIAQLQHRHVPLDSHIPLEKRQGQSGGETCQGQAK